jgi:hypothetical protein
MNDLEMLPDDYDKLQELLLKLNRDLNKSLKYSSLSNLNGQTHLYYFLSDLNNLIETNKKYLQDDLYMNLFYIRKKLANHGN